MHIAQFAKAVFNLSGICKTKKCLFRSTRWRILPLAICVICANCTIYKTVFNLSAICKMKKCLFRSTHWCTVINLCNLCKLHNLQKLFSIGLQSAKWRNVFSDLHIGVPLSICIICANCSICKSCFQFECNLQNEEMSFQVYKLEYRYQIV